ncbi:MAG: two-component regulator propeller domain-containing protein [Bacteroidota bacterium]
MQNFVFAQIPVGSWRDHLPYIEATNIVQAQNKIFCSTPYSLFYYNLDDYSIGKLSITNGLSDIGTSAINYLQEKDLLVVAYSNANLDFIKGINITNLNNIKQKQIQGRKTIHHIEFNDSKAYLACGFGIVLVNLDKLEIEDTYYIGPEASAIEIFSIVFDQDFIYAATEQGVYYAPKNSKDLIDYATWNKDENFPDANGKYTDIINFNNQLFANYYHQGENASYVYKKENNSWELFYHSVNEVDRLKVSNNEMFITEGDKILVYDENLNLKRQITDYGFASPKPADCITDENGKLYIADKASGLVINENANEFESVQVDGPFNNHVDDISSVDNKVWVAGGGRSSYRGNLYNFPEAYSFIDENWNSNILWNSGAHDFVKIIINPKNSSQVFAGAWGSGVFEFQNNEIKNIFNDQNSTLQSQISGEPYIRIAGLAIDENQNLWVANEGVPEPISVKLNDGNWYSLNYPEIDNTVPLGEIIITQNNTKWVQLERGGGLFAFNDNYTPGDVNDDEHKQFDPLDEYGELITNEISSIAEDKDGVIWIGTEQGVLTYFNPQNVFSGENFYADRIKLIDENNDSLVQYLLAKEKITAIAIDGANRKWFGTENSGIYLMSADTREELFHFHTGNSPLFSNSITDIAVNGKTGEVFIGTSLGIVSYKGTATEGNDSYADAYVYPNPVRENYVGLITITGLATDVNVKITDVSGKLVYETTAFGGQAIWNGKNFGNQKVQTGVYLIFCTDDGGKNTKVLKLLFIN